MKKPSEKILICIEHLVQECSDLIHYLTGYMGDEF